ncbi:MAG: peroxiredoxin [Chloroflexi bacterium]|nr:peroxiredoxin [Chloroflexota bacterium]
MSVDVGQPAPDFSLYDAETKKQRKLSEFKGKNVVLAFFPGAFTGVCTKEACTFRDSAAQLNSLNAQVVGVTVDSPFAQKAWADANKLGFPLLSDFGKQVIQQYGAGFKNLAGLEGYVSATRAVFVIDKGGVVRMKWIAPNPGIEPDYAAVQATLAGLK